MRVEKLQMRGEMFSYVYQRSGAVYFMRPDYTGYKLHHVQNCCENVEIVDIVGDLSDLEHTELIVAEVISSRRRDGGSSITWQFYKFSTSKGDVTIQFRGTSNGYYNEEAQVDTVGV
jgi:hypothetical protein